MSESTGKDATTTRPHESGSEPPAGSDLAATVPDLRVARVKRARAHSNADRLLVLEIDLAEEERQIVAGIAQHYAPGELDGKHIVVVANLQHAKLRGEVSQGMLLASERDGTLGLLLAPDAPPGTRLRAEGLAEPPGLITIDAFAAHELRASPEGVTLDGRPLSGARLVMDREAYGRLR